MKNSDDYNKGFREGAVTMAIIIAVLILLDSFCTECFSQVPAPEPAVGNLMQWNEAQGDSSQDHYRGAKRKPTTMDSIFPDNERWTNEWIMTHWNVTRFPNWSERDSVYMDIPNSQEKYDNWFDNWLVRRWQQYKAECGKDSLREAGIWCTDDGRTVTESRTFTKGPIEPTAEGFLDWLEGRVK